MIFWNNLPVLQLNHILWEADCGVRASAQLACSADTLFLHMSATEAHIRAEHRAPLSPVHEDSCLEFFFMPSGESRYLNFEVNPNGCLHIGFGQSRQDRVVVVRRDAAELFQIRTEQSASGWEVYYQIPLSFLRIFYPDFQFTDGLVGNFYKCGDKTVHPHFLAWNNVTSASPDFHRPQDFAPLPFSVKP